MANHIEFTKEMKKDYTILAPYMLEAHFDLVAPMVRTFGYNIEILKNLTNTLPKI